MTLSSLLRDMHARLTSAAEEMIDIPAQIRQYVETKPELGLNLNSIPANDVIVFRGVAENRQEYGWLKVIPSADHETWEAQLMFTYERGFGRRERNQTEVVNGLRTVGDIEQTLRNFSGTMYEPERMPNKAEARYSMLMAILDNANAKGGTWMDRMVIFKYPEHKTLRVFFSDVIKTAVIQVRIMDDTQYDIIWDIVQTTDENQDLILQAAMRLQVRYPLDVFEVLREIEDQMKKEPTIDDPSYGGTPYVEPPEPPPPSAQAPAPQKQRKVRAMTVTECLEFMARTPELQLDFEPYYRNKEPFPTSVTYKSAATGTTFLLIHESRGVVFHGAAKNVVITSVDVFERTLKDFIKEKLIQKQSEDPSHIHPLQNLQDLITRSNLRTMFPSPTRLSEHTFEYTITSPSATTEIRVTAISNNLYAIATQATWQAAAISDDSISEDLPYAQHADTYAALLHMVRLRNDVLRADNQAYRPAMLRAIRSTLGMAAHFTMDSIHEAAPCIKTPIYHSPYCFVAVYHAPTADDPENFEIRSTHSAAQGAAETTKYYSRTCTVTGVHDAVLAGLNELKANVAASIPDADRAKDYVERVIFPEHSPLGLKEKPGWPGGFILTKAGVALGTLWYDKARRLFVLWIGSAAPIVCIHPQRLQDDIDAILLEDLAAVVDPSAPPPELEEEEEEAPKVRERSFAVLDTIPEGSESRSGSEQ